MSFPVVNVEIDFSNGASFAYPLLLDNVSYGILDTNVLGDLPADVVVITDQVMKVSTRRGRNRILSNFEVGSATVTLNDPDSNFSPQNTTGPYYGKLLPLRKIRIYATMIYLGNPIEINLFSGYITSYDTNFNTATNATSTVTLQCADAFRLLNNVSTGTAPIPGATVNQLSGARIDTILDFAAFPNSLRTIDDGNSIMQVDPGGARSILSAIQTIEQSEFGAFFISRSGKARFLSRNYISILADGDPRFYSDTGIPGSLTYSNLDFAFDDQLILNDITVTRNDDGILPAVPQNVTDAASIAKFFTKSGQRTGILVQTDQESLDQANTLLAARKNADLRIDSMSLNMYAPAVDDEVYVINLSSDIYSLVNISKLMPGGSFITKELFIQGVQQDITPSTWTVKLLTAEPLIQAFILDSENNAATGFIGQGYLGENPVTLGTNPLSY